MAKMTRDEFETEVLLRLVVGRIEAMLGSLNQVEKEFASTDANGVIPYWRRLATLAADHVYGK